VRFQLYSSLSEILWPTVYGDFGVVSSRESEDSFRAIIQDLVRKLGVSSYVICNIRAF
jgi:hypothetical protein